MSIKKTGLLPALFIIVAIGVFLQYKYLNEFPRFIHGWAQSDRYALALGFINNHFNFFLPETFVYNHQFPTNWLRPSNSTITAVDFPIHEFMVALLMKLTGSTEPWVFRLYTLLYSLTGLFFLFKLTYLITKNYYKSILVIVFAATSPVYAYYQNGFLPTVPSLANVFIGIYFYCKFIQTNKKKDFLISILFLTLAALSRSTCAIPLVAVFGMETLRILRKKSSIKGKILPVFLSIASILGYVWYNSILREEYGSLFLNLLTTPEDMEEAKMIFGKVYDKWLMHYFSGYHYLLLIILIIAALIYLRDKTIPKNQLLPFGLLFIAILTGACTFLVVMLRQFSAHDYYFLDSFFVPVLLFLIMLLTIIPDFKFKHFKLTYVLLLALITFPLLTNAIETQDRRRDTGSWDVISRVINNFKGSDVFLDSLHVSKDAKIIVFDAGAPNIPFMLMKRKGYMNIMLEKDLVLEQLNWDIDYVIIQDNVLTSSDCLKDPEILSRLNRVGNNGKITVCTVRKTPKEQSVADFLSLSTRHYVFDKMINFEESTREEAWKNIQPSTEIKAYSGSTVGKVSPETEYAVSYEKKGIPALAESSRNMILTGYFYKDRDQIEECSIVVNVKSAGKVIYYQTYNLAELLKQKNTWEKLELMFPLPETEKENEIGVYIWNINKKNTLFVDDFSLKMY